MVVLYITDFNKNLAINISPVTIYPIEVVLVVVFSCLIYSYKHRTGAFVYRNGPEWAELPEWTTGMDF